jgi:hypothetical protein
MVVQYVPETPDPLNVGQVPRQARPTAALCFSPKHGKIAFMAEGRRPLIPQFSVRWILALTTVMAVVSLVFTQALAGHAWAVGIAILLATLVMAFVVYAAAFAGVSLFADLLDALRARRVGQVRADPPESSRPPPTAALILALLIAAGGRTIFAASGTSITLPMLGPGQTNTTGLTLTVDTTWVDSSGYRPVRIELKSSTGAVTADRILTIRIRPKQFYSANDSITATQVIEIPAGTSKAAATISVPAISPWGMFDLDAIEDGQLVEQLSIGAHNRGASYSGTSTPRGDSASPVILFLSNDGGVASSLISMHPQLELLYADDSSAGAVSRAPFGSTPATAMSSPPTTGVVGMSALPSHWIDYTGFDVIVTSLSNLPLLASQNAGQYSAMLEWVQSGGTALVYGVDRDWKKLQEVESFIANEAGHQQDRATNPTRRGWVAPRKRFDFGALGSRDASSFQSTTSWPPQRQPGIDLSLAGETPVNPSESEKEEDDSVSTDDAPFLTRKLGLGTVVAIRSDWQDDGSGSFKWLPNAVNSAVGGRPVRNSYPEFWLFNTIGSNRWNWRQRWGVSLYEQNDHFWDFLIPGVGLVPVVQFQVLITLFVIVIGPVNYYLFKRLGKLNLMVLTVPAGALAITFALLIYALLADGFSVRARARSFTHIDQRSGQAECWTRLSYYAGLSPSGGLTFSQDTAVVPLLAWPGEMQNEPARTLAWKRTNPSDADSPLEQRLTEGWLKSRTPTQFITARVRKTAARLDVKSGGSGSPPQVTNQLGTPIKWLFIVDEDSNCFTADSVATGAAASLKPIESQNEAGAGRFQRLLSENEPAPPLGSQADGRSVFGLYRHQVPYMQSPQYRPGNAGYNQLYNGGSPTTQNTGTLERELADLVEQMIKDKLPPKTYVAVVESSPEVELGTPSAHEESSFHVIRGEW